MNELTVSPSVRLTSEKSARSLTEIKFLSEPSGQVLFLVAHILLAFLIRYNSLVGVAHLVLTLGISAYFLLVDKHPHRLVIIIGYITGAELLWRGFNVSFFYEIAKYVISALCILSILKNRGSAKANIFPLFYFLFLIPSIVQTTLDKEYINLSNIGLLDYPFYFLGLDRRILSFTLSGPFALAACSLLFSTIKLNRIQTKGLLLAILAPIVGLMALAIAGTISNIELVDEIQASSRVTSADIGPNQVSSILGLGLLLAFLLIFMTDKLWLKGLYGLLSVMLATQAMLTFSRGGLWTGLAAIVIASFFLLRDRRSRAMLLVGSAVLVVAVVFVIYPSINALTGNSLATRLSSLDVQGREIAVMEEMAAFAENPIFGAGPGRGSERVIAHTEYSRMIGEHGLFGIFSLIFYGLIILQIFFTRMHPQSKAIVLSFITWTSFNLLHAAMRLSAPSVLFGAALLTYALDDDEFQNESSDLPS